MNERDLSTQVLQHPAAAIVPMRGARHTSSAADRRRFVHRGPRHSPLLTKATRSRPGASRPASVRAPLAVTVPLRTSTIIDERRTTGERRTTKVVRPLDPCMTRDVMIFERSSNAAARREEKTSIPQIVATIPPFRVFTLAG